MNFYTTKQAAHILGISTGMVCRLYREGKLTGLKVNPRCLLIQIDDKFDFLVLLKKRKDGDI